MVQTKEKKSTASPDTMGRLLTDAADDPSFQPTLEDTLSQ